MPVESGQPGELVFQNILESTFGFRVKVGSYPDTKYTIK